MFSQYEEFIYRTTYLYVKNQENVLDVIQETAYRSFKSIRDLKQAKYFRTWITKIVITCAIDILRKNKRTIFIDNYKRDVETIEDKTTEITTSLSLMELLKLLEDDEKTIVILKYYYDYTFSMILDSKIDILRNILETIFNKDYILY